MRRRKAKKVSFRLLERFPHAKALFSMNEAWGRALFKPRRAAVWLF